MLGNYSDDRVEEATKKAVRKFVEGLVLSFAPKVYARLSSDVFLTGRCEVSITRKGEEVFLSVSGERTIAIPTNGESLQSSAYGIIVDAGKCMFDAMKLFETDSGETTEMELLLKQFSSWIGQEHYIALFSPFAPMLFVEFIETLWDTLSATAINGVALFRQENERIVTCGGGIAVRIVDEKKGRKMVEVFLDALELIAQRMARKEKEWLTRVLRDRVKEATTRLLRQLDGKEDSLL